MEKTPTTLYVAHPAIFYPVLFPGFPHVITSSCPHPSSPTVIWLTLALRTDQLPMVWSLPPCGRYFHSPTDTKELLYDPASVMNGDTLKFCLKEAWCKLSFFVLSFFYYLYWWAHARGQCRVMIWLDLIIATSSYVRLGFHRRALWGKTLTLWISFQRWRNVSANHWIK